MEKKYTDEDLIELIKIHDDTLQQAQKLVYNIRILVARNDKNGIVKELNLLENLLYKYRLYNQEDIKKSESDICNNNSL